MHQRHLHPTSPHAIRAAIRHARKVLCRRLDDAVAEADDHFPHAYASIVAAVEAGFRHEELMMETLGYERLREHIAENAVILGALHRVMAQVEYGDCLLGRQVLTALRDVMALHRLSADLAAAAAAHPGALRLHGQAARATLHVAGHRRHMH
jgi:hemerythrin